MSAQCKSNTAEQLEAMASSLIGTPLGQLIAVASVQLEQYADRVDELERELRESAEDRAELIRQIEKIRTLHEPLAAALLIKPETHLVRSVKDLSTPAINRASIAMNKPKRSRAGKQR